MNLEMIFFVYFIIQLNLIFNLDELENVFET